MSKFSRFQPSRNTTSGETIIENGDLIVSGSVIVTGNLDVLGTTTTISSSHLVIQDPLIGLGFGSDSNPTHTGAVGDRGFIFGLAGNNNQALIWDQTSGSFVLGKVNAQSPVDDAIDIAPADLSTFKVGAFRSGDLSSSARVFAHGLETSGLLGVSGSIKNGSFISSSGEIFGTDIKTSANVFASGTLSGSNVRFSGAAADLSGSGRLFGFGIETSGHFAASGTIRNSSFVSSSGEIFGTDMATSGDVEASGSIEYGGPAGLAGTGVSEGGGGTGAVLDSFVGELNNEIVTTIRLDIHGLNCATGQSKVIGNASAAANAFITQLDAAVNGVIYKAEMGCVEMPGSGGTVLTDIDLVVSTAALNAQADASAAANFKAFIAPGGNYTPGVQVRSTVGASLDSDVGGSGYFLYIVNGAGGTSTGEYNAGQFIIKLYGAKPF
jgi:hypothetical protein|tara:strand:+ start:2164 stop:3477 length:1314 start_codon:yes stop_codon:yes gene_type:complete